VFRTSGYGADAAVFVEYALAAGHAFFRPGCPLFENTDELRIEAGINRLVISFGNGLNPGAASQGKNDIVSVDRVRRLFDKNVVALPFNRQFLDLEAKIIQPGSDAQRRRDDADFAFPPGQADRYACAAPSTRIFFLPFKVSMSSGMLFLCATIMMLESPYGLIEQSSLTGLVQAASVSPAYR